MPNAAFNLSPKPLLVCSNVLQLQESEKEPDIERNAAFNLSLKLLPVCSNVLQLQELEKEPYIGAG